jgi:hypothetical protein
MDDTLAIFCLIAAFVWIQMLTPSKAKAPQLTVTKSRARHWFQSAYKILDNRLKAPRKIQRRDAEFRTATPSRRSV